jgi:hypothetical protein
MLNGFVHRFILPTYYVFIDECKVYKGIQHQYSTVVHGFKEWACCDNDGDVFDVHTNSVEGLWTGLHNSLRPFSNVSKLFLSCYVAVHEFRVNLKRISPKSISTLVAVHSFYS